MKTIVIIPTYNEKENIKKLISDIFKIANIHVLVVDDNSPDKTYKIVEELMEKYRTKLFLIKRKGKLGLGTAYIAGFKWALDKKYDYIIQMDADFSHNPLHIKEFLQEIKENDVILGSRYVKGGGTKNWSPIRKMISRGGSLYSRIILSVNVNDLTGGFKCYKKKVLEAIDLDSIKSNGYCFQIEMTYRSLLKGFKIKEIPIIFDDRRVGKSKMSKKIFLEAIIKVPMMRSFKNKFR